MADFVQTMKDWRRMCKTFTTDDDESCCEGCPIMALEIAEHGCDAIFSEWADKADWEEVEDVIETWAAEHPVVYPTWAEWLVDSGVFPQKMSTIPSIAFNTIRDSLSVEIPADIAQKLGIKPKEG